MPTPDPTDEEFLEALPLVDARVSVALNEIVRRLKNNMPSKISALNTRLGYSGKKGIPKPDGYFVGPIPLGDESLNAIVVYAETETQALSPGTFKQISQVVVCSINGRIEAKEQTEDARDRSGVIRGILYHFLTGCLDLQERMCWRLLEPGNVTMLPEPFESYSGVACYFQMVQSPDENNWI